MIIAFDASRAFTQDRTGTENYSYQLLTHLAKIDHTNKYLVYYRPGNKIPEFNWPDNFSFKLINYSRLWTQVGLSLQTFKDKADILFVPAHTIPIIIKPGLKTLVTVHDLGAEYLPRMHQLKQQLYLKAMTHYQLKQATHLIAVSQSTKQDLIKKVGCRDKDITVIYEGIDTKVYKKIDKDGAAQVLNNYNLTFRDFFFFVGTIQPRKNLLALIKAYKIFLDKKYPTTQESAPLLVLAGNKGWLSDDIYKLPKKLNIDNQVKFLGRIPDADLSALYSSALGFVYPSLFEGFGLPILEAFSCQTPVLTSNLSSMPEVAGKAAILVDPYNIQSIADGMIKLIDPKTRIKLIKLARTQVQKFSWENCAKQTLKLIERIYLDES